MNKQGTGMIKAAIFITNILPEISSSKHEKKICTGLYLKDNHKTIDNCVGYITFDAVI